MKRLHHYTELATGRTRQPATAQLLVAVLAIATFSPTFCNLLMTGWDDQWQVTNHYTTGGFTWDNLRSIFTEAHGTQYSPLNQCLYTLLYSIGGYNPTLFHAASLLVHVANSCLVYQLLRTLLADTKRLPLPQTADIALLTTLLFAIHPLQVEAVAWVSASKILLNTFFYLLATRTFIRFLHSRSPSSYASTLFFFICSYGCKEQALIFPVWATWLSLFYGHNLRSGFAWKSLVPFYLISVLFGLVFVCDISSSRDFGWQELLSADRTTASLLAYTWTQRLVFCCYSVAEYVTKWYVPLNLLYLYPFPMQPGEPLPLWLLSYPLALAIIFFALWSCFRHRAVQAGTSFFLIHLLPVLHIIPIGRAAIVADRYIYLASVGISFIAVYYLVSYYREQNVAIRRHIRLGIAFILCALSLYSFQRTRVWHDTDSLRKKMKELKAPDKGKEELAYNKYVMYITYLINNNFKNSQK